MKIRKIEWRNFSSYGNKKQILEFDENASLVQIVGENGAGKCLDPSTKLNLRLYNNVTIGKINEFILNK
jgi:hypothetical protein